MEWNYFFQPNNLSNCHFFSSGIFETLYLTQEKMQFSDKLMINKGY